MEEVFTNNAQFTVGGVGQTSNFYGTIASMVISTLKIDNPIPDDTQIKLMIRDPKQWEQNLSGQEIREYNSNSEGNYNDYTVQSKQMTMNWVLTLSKYG